VANKRRGERRTAPRQSQSRTPATANPTAAGPVWEECYRAVAELTSDWMYAFRVEPDGSLVREWVSDRFRRASGYSDDDIDTRDWTSVIHPDDLRIALQQHQRLLAGHDDVSEYRILTKNGDVRWLRSYCRPVWDAARQRTARIVGAAQDVSEHRRAETELFRVHQEEAEVANALARVGREIISSLDTPVLLDRLSQLTAEVLRCDSSHTFLWENETQTFVPMSGFGDTAEQSESVRVMRFPGTVVTKLLDRFREQELIQVSSDDATIPVLPALQAQYGVSHTLYVALRRGTEIAGILTAGYRGREAPFSPKHERIARGIAQSASLALENARLVEALARANNLKADFVASMSHELRTPLHVILGYNDLLLDHTFGSLTPEQRETIARVRARARELLDLVNTTLDLSRLETGRIPLSIETMSVQRLMADLDNETQIVREKPGVEFRWSVAPDLPPLTTDPLKLKVVLKNLIVNAVKFTDAGRIEVAAERSGDAIELSVRDTGIGIAPKDLPLIFDPFHQVQRQPAHGSAGVGLGLHIVRRLLDALQGSITVDSVLHQGSCFRVRLPLEPPAARSRR